MKEPLILGGGLAGLSAGYHSNGTIFEEKSNVGGHARSSYKNGFIFDEGIHVLHTKNEYVLNLIEEINADLDIRDRNAWIFSHGAMTRFPFQANTYGLPLNIVKDCLIGFIKNDFIDKKKIKNYEDWIHYMFGNGIAKHFLVPYSQKFWGVDAKELTTDWVSVRHPKPTIDEVLTGALQEQKKGFGINAVYRYPKQGGFGNIAKCLANKCNGRIKTNMEVTNIDPYKKEIEFNSEEIIGYENVISTLPLPDLIKILPDDVPIDVKDATGRLKTNSMFVVNIGINREKITDKNWIYYLDKKYSFVRLSFPSNQSDHVSPPGTSSISAEIAYGHSNPLPVSKEKLADRVIDELISLNILKNVDEIVYLDTIDIKYAYVIFDKERKPAVQKIHKYLKTIGIIPCGRYGIWAYLWSDEAILSGKKAVEILHKMQFGKS